ncbi:MAG: DNA repair exonuclease [Deltaproteobacteria bacterium]|nr:DNA repair exonuclease [Deltaproteobacteria bacterium]
MKFLHTADWQIGMKAAHVGEAGERVREERIKTVRRLVDVARDNHAEFILVVGDTFEDNAVARVLVQKIADILARANIPIFIIPGNHDPFTPGSVWEHPVWKTCDNLQVLLEEKPVAVAGGFLYPCPVDERHSGKDPTTWIGAAGASGIRVGMAHGTVEGVHQEEPDYPIPREAAARLGLDYLALGHWHSTATYEDSSGAVRMAYSGTHETTRFAERDSGNVLLVEIADSGTPPVVRPIHVGALDWRVMEVDLREAGDLSRLRESIEHIESAQRILLDIRISGPLFSDEKDEIDRIKEILDSRFLFGRIDATHIIPSPEDENWIANLPAGIIRETGARLKELCNPNFSGRRPDWASPDVASRALIELYAFMSEASR